MLTFARKRGREPAPEHDEPLPKRLSDGVTARCGLENMNWPDVMDFVFHARLGLGCVAAVASRQIIAGTVTPVTLTATEARILSAAAAALATPSTSASAAAPVVASSSAAPPRDSPLASPTSLRIRSLAHRFNDATDRKARKRILDEVRPLALKADGKSRFIAEVLQGNPDVLDHGNRFSRANNKSEQKDLWKEAFQFGLRASFFAEIIRPKKRPLTTVGSSVV